MLYAKTVIVDEEENVIGIYDKVFSFTIGEIKYIVVYKNGKEGLLDQDGNEVFPIIYDHISTFEEKYIKLIIGDYIGLATKEGKILFKPERYIDIDEFENDLAIVKVFENGKRMYGFIDREGKEVIEATYDEAYRFYKYDYAKVKLHGLWGLIRRDGTSIGKIKYYDVNAFVDKYALVKDKYTCNYIDRDGNEVFDIWFDELPYGYFDDRGLQIVRSNGKYGVISKDGKVVHEPKYEEIEWFDNDGISIAKLNGKYGYLSTDGKVLTEFIFDSAKHFNGSLKAKVRIGMKSYYLGRDFKIYK